MLRVTTIVVSLFLCFAMTAAGKSRNTLLEAIMMHESGGDDDAVGDKHLPQKAYGCLQIRQPCVDDVNRAYGTNYKASDCLGDRRLSIMIFTRYMAIYATPERLGRAVTDEDRARIWNGGPTGYKRKTTQGYWAKVQKHL